MTERWTPGPWGIEDDFTVSAQVGAVICNVLSFDDFPCVEPEDETAVNDEAMANARLIGAAPELYDALVAIASYAEAQPPNAFEQIHRLARAALARARGEP